MLGHKSELWFTSGPWPEDARTLSTAWPSPRSASERQSTCFPQITSILRCMLQCYDVAIVVSASWIISRTLEKYQRSLRHWNSLLISCPQPPEVTTLPLLLCLVTLKKITIQFAFRKACKKTDKIRSLFSEWTIFQNKQRNTRLGRLCCSPKRSA